MEKFKSKRINTRRMSGKEGALQFSSTPPFGLPGHPRNLYRKDSMDERSSLCPAQQYDTPQRAKEMHEELTEGMEMKGDNHAESQLHSWKSCWRPMLILVSPKVFSNRKIPHTNPASKLGSYNCWRRQMSTSFMFPPRKTALKVCPKH